MVKESGRSLASEERLGIKEPGRRSELPSEGISGASIDGLGLGGDSREQPVAKAVEQNEEGRGQSHVDLSIEGCETRRTTRGRRSEGRREYLERVFCGRTGRSSLDGGLAIALCSRPGRRGLGRLLIL